MSETAAMGRATILFVENEWIVAAPSIELLSDTGFTVLEATSGKRALELLQQHPETGLMIVDIGLPGMDGNAVIRAARADRPSLRVLVVTGYDRSVVEAPEDAITRYLGKPYMPGELVDEVVAMLSAGSSAGSTAEAGPPPT
jgi:two-component system cell cycle sensor histidine kinase/response regulator CckA